MHRFFLKVAAVPEPLAVPVGPYWVLDVRETYTRVLAYAPDQAALLTQFVDPLEVHDDGAHDPVYSERFPRPEWWTE